MILVCLWSLASDAANMGCSVWAHIAYLIGTADIAPDGFRSFGSNLPSLFPDMSQESVVDLIIGLGVVVGESEG